jgi:diguanylate cyclase (GGDEF)-like protein
MLSETTSQELADPTQIAERDEHYRSMIRLLARTLTPAFPFDSVVTARLRAIEAEFEQPLETAKIAEHSARLEDSVGALKRELQRLRQVAETGTAGPPSDSATGLPGPAAAQQLIESRAREGKETFAAVLVLDQLRALNARFGRTVGDEVLMLAAQELDMHLGDAGILHRWRGPAFLVICTKGQQQVDDLGEKIQALVAKRLEKTLNVESRAIHVKITFTCHMEALAADEPAEVAVRRFDDFVGSHGTGVRKTRDLA